MLRERYSYRRIASHNSQCRSTVTLDPWSLLGSIFPRGEGILEEARYPSEVCKDFELFSPASRIQIDIERRKFDPGQTLILITAPLSEDLLEANEGRSIRRVSMSDATCFSAHNSEMMRRMSMSDYHTPVKINFREQKLVPTKPRHKTNTSTTASITTHTEDTSGEVAILSMPEITTVLDVLSMKSNSPVSSIFPGLESDVTI